MSETNPGPPRRTPLHESHLALGARMVPFGGWEMPVQYAGVMAEHAAVRDRAGIFDVSHMGELVVRGPQALEFLQHATVNDVARLRVGRAHYNMLPNERGGLVDDIYVYRTGDTEFLVVVNASNIAKDLAHLRSLAGPYEVELTDESDRWALVAVQGPAAERLLAPHAGADLAAARKNSVFETRLLGLDARLARTGYTGEDGFEVFVPAEAAPALWERLLELGLEPAGLGARDTLRLEAGFPLYGHELHDDTSPLATPFAWVVKDSKAFFGREAMLARPVERRLAGLRVSGRGIPREGYPIAVAGEPVGRVTSGTMSPSLKVGIALAYLDPGRAPVGSTVQIEVRGQDLPAEVVEPVFVSRSSPAPGA